MSIDHLAILGGPPEFAQPLHVGRPNIPNRAGFESRMAKVLDSGWLTNDGPMVRELEAEICNFLDVEHCVAVANATVGLEILLRSMGLCGEVIVPSFTFIATAHVVAMSGLTPVFCDIDPTTHNLDPTRVAELIGPKTAAILGVHLWGRPCAIDALQELAQAARAPLIFDAAHALACAHGQRLIGNFGEAEVFSLHATKFLHSFEGGLITTGDPELARRLRLARNFGFAGYDNVISLGTNAKMSEAHAAMALANLEARDALLAHNHNNLAEYARLLGALPETRFIDTRLNGAGNAQYAILEVPEATRDPLVAALHQENVLARRYFYPGAHRCAPYNSVPISLPISEAVSARVLALPTGLAVGKSEIARVAGLVVELLRDPSKLARLS